MDNKKKNTCWQTGFHHCLFDNFSRQFPILRFQLLKFQSPRIKLGFFFSKSEIVKTINHIANSQKAPPEQLVPSPSRRKGPHRQMDLNSNFPFQLGISASTWEYLLQAQCPLLQLTLHLVLEISRSLDVGELLETHITKHPNERQMTVT